MTNSAESPFWGRGADDWIALQEPLHRPLYDALLDAAAVSSGGTLLDAGCGGGAVSVLATARGLVVTGLDISEFFLEVARRRVPDATFIRGDVQQLPFAASAFDGVVAANSFQFAADCDAAMREAGRVLRTRGRVAIGVFDERRQCDAAVPIASIFKLLDRDAFGEPGPFALSAEGRLEAIVQNASLTLENAFVVDTPFTYADCDAAVRAFASAGPGQQARLQVGEDVLIAELRKALEPYRRPDGSYELRNGFKVAVGRKA